MTTTTRLQSEVEILSRLTKGQKWLTDTDATLCEQDHEWTPLRRRFADALDAWCNLENALRVLWQYQGCIRGQGQQCPEDAVARCAACAGGAA